jgi:hypothetical protein
VLPSAATGLLVSIHALLLTGLYRRCLLVVWLSPLLLLLLPLLPLAVISRTLTCQLTCSRPA